VEVNPLENHLQGELSVKRFAETDAGSAIEITDGVEGQTESVLSLRLTASP